MRSRPKVMKLIVLIQRFNFLIARLIFLYILSKIVIFISITEFFCLRLINNNIYGLLLYFAIWAI